MATGDGSEAPLGQASKAGVVDTRGRKRLGAGGERLAATWLEARGYRIVARNWRCQWGELDLVAEDRQGATGECELVFVEVKTRRGAALGLPEEALTRRKQQHLVAAAQSYLEASGTPERAYRIDVVAIQLAPSGKLLEVRHYERAVGE